MVTETSNNGGVTVEDLTPRQLQVVLLVGRDRLSYKAAARRMEHAYQPGRTVSSRTVGQYATEIRDLVRPDLAPRDALTWFYLQHREQIEAAA